MKRTLIVLVCAVVPAIALSGCSVTDKAGAFFKEAADKGGEIAEGTKKDFGEALDIYCERVPSTARLTLRSQVNEYADKGKIKIDCTPDDRDEDN